MVIQPKPEEETQSVQQPGRMNFITNEQRMHVKTSMEMLRMDKCALSPAEISEVEKVRLHLKKDEQTSIQHPALFDAGSTVNVLTPGVAEKMIKELGTKHVEVFAFMV